MKDNLDLLLVDKPKGISSFDVIRILRKELGIKKMGHAGTLDPFATGLLIIGIGSGTKKLSQLIGLSKVYEAELLLGMKTDTGDITGNIIEEKSIPTLSEEDITQAVADMVGTHTLSVPIYSAIKKDGKPLYAYAREGKQVDVPKKDMTIQSASVVRIDLPSVHVRFYVSSGSYIRTLGEVLAQKLGTVGTLANLRRLSIGEFLVDNARTVSPAYNRDTKKLS